MMLKIRVPGHRVLVKGDPVEEVTAGGIVIARPGHGQKLEQQATDRGTVVEVGPMCWKNYDFDKPDWKPWCKPGDRVIFARYAGKLIKHPETEEEFFLLNDEDIQVVMEEVDD
jgi:co-chaperonin GroES (HSP10)